MDLVWVSLASLVVAGLTLFSGFGLGTLLMPVFALFFPLEVAVGATAVVHLANNLFKVWLVGRKASWPVALRFGLPAIPAAFLGASLLARMSQAQSVIPYSLGDRHFETSPLGLVLGIVIAVFALLELVPVFDRLAFGRKILPLGGLLSGFFGGLSGHQGALRSAFLLKWGLTKEAFIGTGVVCAVAVDITRLSVYGTMALSRGGGGLYEPRVLQLLVVATLAAFLGSFFGAKLLPKVTMTLVRRLVGAMLLLLAAGIGSGVI
jgi:uncharacterized membrane protein YfcA